MMQSVMSAKWFKWAAGGAAGLLLLLLMVVPMFSGAYNRAVTLEENVHTSKSNISKEEQRRVDLFNNLVDAVQSAKNFEQETQTKIAEARSQANKGQVDNAMLTIASVVEAYPEIKSTELYKQTMTEFSVTENRLAGFREQYNNDVREYKRFTRGFFTRIGLIFTSYNVQDFDYLDYKVNNSEARNLFNE
jgi:LemA protein